MNNFGILYQYECKKLLHKKIVWISFSVCIAIIILSLLVPLMGNYYIDGELIDTNYNMYQIDKRYKEALNGREIDQKLLEETIAGYRTIPETPVKHYISTEEYQQYARPYSEVFTFICRATRMPTSEVMLTWQPSEEDLYAKRQEFITSLWEEMRLSEGEMNFWRERESEIKTPYTYQVHDGYNLILSSYQTVGLFVLMIIAICLSGIFSDEHTRKTDSIILASSLGKRKLYWAKIAAGISFAVISTLLFFVVTSVTTICIYGVEDFHAAFQLLYATSSNSITCGQAVMIAYGAMVFAAIITSVIVMVLSELLHSNIATLAVSTGLLISAMIVMVPEQYRVLAQIWDWMPWCFLTPWNVFGQYTLSVFGYYLTPWQAVPMIYIVLSFVIAVVGKPVYERFQVAGR